VYKQAPPQYSFSFERDTPLPKDNLVIQRMLEEDANAPSGKHFITGTNTFSISTNNSSINGSLMPSFIQPMPDTNTIRDLTNAFQFHLNPEDTNSFVHPIILSPDLGAEVSSSEENWDVIRLASEITAQQMSKSPGIRKLIDGFLSSKEPRDKDTPPKVRLREALTQDPLSQNSTPNGDILAIVQIFDMNMDIIKHKINGSDELTPQNPVTHIPIDKIVVDTDIVVSAGVENRVKLTLIKKSDGKVYVNNPDGLIYPVTKIVDALDANYDLRTSLDTKKNELIVKVTGKEKPATGNEMFVLPKGFDVIVGYDKVLPSVAELLGPASNNKAMRSNRQGGIDLTVADMNLQTQNEGEEIKFHLDPAMLARLQNAPGFVPVIINIQPLEDLSLFLGLQKEANTAPDI